MNQSHTEFDRLLTSGIDAVTHAAIGEIPCGPGVLAVPILIRGEA